MEKMRSGSLFFYCRLSLLAFVLPATRLLAAGGEGRPFIRNYTPREYGAAPSNWAIVQDQRGVMYFGNAEGLLEYDGVSWRRIATPNRTVTRSLAIGRDGRIYVGEVGSFGYLAPDSIGRMTFVSLQDQAPEQDRSFADVWSTSPTSKGVYFTTHNTLFRYKPHGGERKPGPEYADGDSLIQVWKARTRFQFAFVVRDTLYVDQKDIGLMQMVGDSLQPVPGGERFASKRIYVMLPYDETRILVGTMMHGLYLYDGTDFSPFSSEAETFVRQNQLYGGVSLSQGRLALATIRGGVVLIDRAGKQLQLIDKTTGLQDNSVLTLYADQQGGLWIGLFNGLARVETPGPVSTFSEEAGLEGGVVSLTRYQGKLYVATGLGVFYLDQDRSYQDAFQSVSGIETQSWSLLNLDDRTLLAATNGGVFQITGSRATNLGFKGATSLRRSGTDPNTVFVGLITGLGMLRLSRGIWGPAGEISGVEEEIRSIAEREDNELWLGTKSQGILRIEWEKSGNGHRLQRFGKEAGVPGGEINVYSIAGRLFFVSADRGLFRYQEDLRHFVPDSTFGSSFASGTIGIETLAEDAQGNVWLVAKGETGDEINHLIHGSDGTFHLLRTPFLRIPKATLWAIYPEPLSAEVVAAGTQEIKNIVWCGGADGLIRYDEHIKKDYEAPFATLIRRVTVDGDSLVFGGAGTIGDPGSGASAFSSQIKTLRFEFSATSFEAEESNQFQTYLVGFDAGWSSWSPEVKKDYTNLAPGSYVFRVRSRNIYEKVGPEASYRFSFEPPWYRAWWAYAAYGLVFVLLVLGVDRFQRHNVIRRERERAEINEAKLRAQAFEAENKALQAENERKELELQKTQELQDAYHALEQAHLHLKATQQQLITQEKLASLGQLTAGIAHEIKNPLNFVNNFAELSLELLDELQGEMESNRDKKVSEIVEELADILSDLKQNAHKINLHGKRADGIVRSMLQHSRGTKAERQQVNINEMLQEDLNLAFHGFKAQDAAFNCAIEKHLDESIAKVFVVPQDISRVFLNIIGNGFYAAYEKKKQDGDTFLPSLMVTTRDVEDVIEIRIRDNGNGLSENVREKLFQPFFTTKPAGEGTGLGLSISYDIVVQEHGGELTVESSEGEFTEFIIRLPKGETS